MMAILRQLRSGTRPAALAGLVLLLATVPGLPAAIAAVDGPAIGEKAPDFSLTDTTDRGHTLSEYKGRPVVLLWLNLRCPYVERILDSKLVQQMWRNVRAIDDRAIVLVLNSTADATAEENAAMIEQYELKMPVLLDDSGAVAEAYDARLTPQAFVIDAEGNLAYNGAFDNDPTGARAETGKEVVNYVERAVAALHAGKQPDPATTRPYGCRIKVDR